MEKTFLEQIGDRVNTGRIRRGFSRKQLAERAGVHISSVIRIERGQEAVAIDDAVKICNELELSIEYILTGECGMVEFLRMQQYVLNMPDLNSRNLQRVATAFWEAVPRSYK